MSYAWRRIDRVRPPAGEYGVVRSGRQLRSRGGIDPLNLSGRHVDDRSPLGAEDINVLNQLMGVRRALSRFGPHITLPVKDDLRSAVSVSDGIGPTRHQPIHPRPNPPVDRYFRNKVLAIIGKFRKGDRAQRRRRDLLRVQVR